MYSAPLRRVGSHANRSDLSLTAAAVACVVGTALAVGGLLLAEAREHRLGLWTMKPLASTGFLLLALTVGALDSSYGRLVLAGLAASWLGDVLLIPRGARRTFVLGLLSFLLGHVIYSAAFAQQGAAGAIQPWVAGVVAVSAALALRWLWPHAGSLRPAVVAYVVVISVMVVLAAGASAATGRAAILVGALLFWVSDLAVARQRFVAPGPVNRFWGLPAYYAGQLVLASTAASS